MDPRITRRTAIQAGVGLTTAAGLGLAPLARGRQAKTVAVEAYTDQLSYAPGDEVRLHVSCGRPVTLAVNRVGRPYSPLGPVRGFATEEHPIPADVSSHGCGWPVAYSFRLP